MRHMLVAGNWKMNGSKDFVKEQLARLVQSVTSLPCQSLVIPPFVYLEQAQQCLNDSGVALGAQTVSEHQQGAYTGEISASMLVDMGCTHVLVGHSERRSLYQETDEQVAQKSQAAQSAGLIPIFCVGEHLSEREQNLTESVVQGQLDAVIALAGVKHFTQAIIAYEPVWAIGTGKTATPEQAQAVHYFIRNYLAKQDDRVAQNVVILYGGSVKSSNAKALFSMPDIDGGLVGGASLDAQEFINICLAAG